MKRKEHFYSLFTSPVRHYEKSCTLKFDKETTKPNKKTNTSLNECTGKYKIQP